MKMKVYIVASTNIESTKAFTNHLFAQDYRDELQQAEPRDKVTIIEQEIDLPVYAVTFTSHAREDWDEHLHTEAPGLFLSKREAEAAFEANKNYARATAANEYEDSEYCAHVTPDESEEDEGDRRYYTATRCKGDEPKDYYIGRVELHTL